MKKIETDILVLGSGIAGLSFAIKAAALGKVAVVTKASSVESNTRLAQGGIACVLDKEDDFKKHIEDTLVAGAGHCNMEAVELVVTRAPQMIGELVKLGVNFNRDQSLTLELGKEGGHSHHRIVHANDKSGMAVQSVLIEEARRIPNIRFFEYHFAIDLTQIDNVCSGAVVYDSQKDEYIHFSSYYTMLATGGAGYVYEQTTNPEIATGDGFAMAYNAGAKVSDMEFVQFHPTALYHSKANGFLISEALRGFGANLVLPDGRSFMEKYHPMGSLAPRDVVSRAIFNEMSLNDSTCMYLDATGLSTTDLIRKFPAIYENCYQLGIDITEDWIPVVPAAHYMCGGVLTDIHGQTNIENLYALGEVACTGVHGANRLASNSLLEGLVFADQAYQHIIDRAGKWSNSSFNDTINSYHSKSSADIYTIHYLKDQVRSLMWNAAGIIRSSNKLFAAVKQLEQIEHTVSNLLSRYKRTPDLIELRNMCITSKLIIRAALERSGSLGTHYIEKSEIAGRIIKDQFVS